MTNILLLVDCQSGYMKQNTETFNNILDFTKQFNESPNSVIASAVLDAYYSVGMSCEDSLIVDELSYLVSRFYDKELIKSLREHLLSLSDGDSSINVYMVGANLETSIISLAINIVCNNISVFILDDCVCTCNDCISKKDLYIPLSIFKDIDVIDMSYAKSFLSL